MMRNQTHFVQYAGSLLAAASLAITTPPADAQDALGAGNVLDANLNVQGRGNLSQQPIDYRARNLLVTGNVAAGRGFRGTVGYTAADDFRGELGADNLYNFRSDSAFSTIDYVNSGTTFNQVRYGQQLGLVEYRRDFSGASLETIGARGPYQMDGGTDQQLNLQRINFDTESSRLAERAGSPRIVGGGYDAEGNLLYVSASPLRGLEYAPADDASFTQGLSPYDRMRLASADDPAAETSFNQPLFTMPDSMGRINPAVTIETPSPDRVDMSTDDRAADDAPLTAAGNRVDARIDPYSDANYQAILQRVAERYANDPDVTIDVQKELLDSLGEQYAELQEMLAGRDDADPDDPAATRPPDLGPNLPGITTPPSRDDAEDDESVDQPPVIAPRSDLSGLTEALRHGTRIEALTDEQKTRYNELMRAAEQRLAEGDYLWAEQRFQRAMRFKHGDPFAVAGMGHAQIGARLYPTASLTLQRLLAVRPEMIDVLYAEGLLPNRPAMNEAANSLEDRLDRGSDMASNGFLLAYIGHQLDDRDLINRGLEAFDRAEPTSELGALLRTIWLEGGSAPPPSE